MKNCIIVFVLALIWSHGYAQVAINNNNSAPNQSAMLDVQSTLKGFLPPRLSTAQRNAISSPATGLMVFNTDLNCLEFYSGAATGWFCPCLSYGDPDCNDITLSGIYRSGVTLNAGNNLTLTVNVLIPGGYQIITNFVNGYYFFAKGTFTSTGNHTVTLYGSGTPLFSGTDDFGINYGGETCYFSVTVQQPPSPSYFRSGIFLHHSTGSNIWGPNGSATSVPQAMITYNTIHGFSGLQAITMNEEWWAPGDNEWVTQHDFFENPSPLTGIGFYLPDNKIIVIKSCFPSSAMSGLGQPSDTLTPWLKTLYNYKWHWRHIVQVMSSHPDNFFVIWTNAPLEYYSTNLSEASISKQFCAWAKDTLAQGLDPTFGAFPPNVYVFDFFHKLTGTNGIMLEIYAASHGDSHPNSGATQLVAPQFVQEIFDAAIGYEAIAPAPAE
ncbi:MAG: hypothetical protein WCP32_16290 [Bacteroidota bacterium]